MGIRQARTPAGTKPSMLASQVPTVDTEEALMREIASATPKKRLSSAQEEAMPEPTPMPLPGPAIAQPEMATQDQFAGLPTEDQFADLPSIDDTIPEPVVDVNNFSFSLGGRDVRMSNGIAEIYDSDEKKWRSPTGTEKFIAAMTLDTISNAPAIAGQIGGAYVGRGIPFPGAAAVGGIAGGMGGATLNEDVLNAMRKDPDTNRYITALEAISGESASPMGALETGALSVIGEGLGAVLGRAFKRGAKLLKAGDVEAEKAFVEGLPKAAETAEAAKRLGIDVKAADVAATLPGGGQIAEKEAMVGAGILGEGAKIAYERQVNAQRDALVKVLQDARRMVGGEEAVVPSASIAKAQRVGFENLNVVDRYIMRFKETLSSLRNGVSETARSVQYDPAQLMEGVKSQIKQFAGTEDVFKPDGSIDIPKLQQYSKEFLASDQDSKLFTEQVALLQKIINRDSALARSAGSDAVFVESVFVDPATKYESKVVQEQLMTRRHPIEPPGVGGGPEYQVEGLPLFGEEGKYAGIPRPQYTDISTGKTVYGRGDLPERDYHVLGGPRGQPGAEMGQIGVPKYEEGGFTGARTPGGPSGALIEGAGQIQEPLFGTPVGTAGGPRMVETPARRFLSPRVSGGAEAGFTFDDISRLVDHFQDLAVKTDNPKMKKLAGMALDYENTIMEKAYRDSGNAAMADTVKAAKEVFHQEIDTLNAVRKRIGKGIEQGTLGDAILKMPPEDIKLFKSFLSKNELAEARMKAFNQAVINESILNPNKTVNATYIQNKFFKDEKTRESMLELFGKEGVDNINAALNIAKVLENKNLSPQAYVRITNDLSGQLMKMERKLGPLQYGKALIGFLSNGNDKVTKMLQENISNYQKAMKPKPREKTIRALELGAEASKVLQSNQVGKGILLENLIQSAGEE